MTLFVGTQMKLISQITQIFTIS